MLQINIVVLIYSRFFALFARLFEILFTMFSLLNTTLRRLRIALINFVIIDFISHNYYKLYFKFVFFVVDFFALIDYDAAITTSNKFTKRITIVFNRIN